MSKPRCGKCKPCKHVEVTKMLLMPVPHGPHVEHADDLTVRCWNKVLKDNPCVEWKELPCDSGRVDTCGI